MSAREQPAHTDPIAERVRAVVSEVLDRPADTIAPDSRFIEDLQIDSFDLLSLYMALEEEFDREIPEEAAGGINTLDETVAFIRSHLASETQEVDANQTRDPQQP